MSAVMRRMLGWLVAVVIVVGAGPAAAAEIKLLSAGAVRAIVTELAQAFEKETGHKVIPTFGTVGVVRQKLAAEPVDLVIMSDTAIDDAIKQGSVVAGSRADIARTGIGVAVREGAPRPDVSTSEALKQALLAAKSIVYVDPAQGGTSGIHFAGVLQRLGIAEAVKPKTTLVPGGYPAELVAKGEVELVVHQISEILPVKGVTLVGPLPRDVQKITTYSTGLPTKAEAVEPARAFVTFLTSASVKPKFAAAGLDYRE